MTDLPDKWVTTTVGESAAFLTGFPFASSGFVDNGIRLVRGSNVKRATLDWTPDISKFWPTDEPALRTFHLRDGDIVIAMDGALVGRSYARVRATDLPAYLVQRVARLRGKSVAQSLLYQWIGSDRFVQHVDSVKTHTAIPHISPQDIRGFPIAIPSGLLEQNRIGDALADADDLIDSLERMIAKKQAMKKGMMQELLTAKTRLPGFTTNWVPVRLRDVGSTYGGLIGKVKGDFGVGPASYITFMEVMRGARLLGRELERVNVKPGERQNRVQRGDVLFNGSSETPEEVALAAVVDFDPPPRTYLNSFCFGYRLKEPGRIHPAYLAYFFRSGPGRALVASLAQGATRYNIAKTKLLQLSPELPSYEEQDAVVSVLTAVEAEIDRLRERLSKTRNLKQGMLQELLTGRTRLIAGVVA